MLKLFVSGSPIYLRPCPAAKVDVFFAIRQLLPLSVGDIAANPSYWSELQSLVNLHPRADREGFGFELPDNYWQLDGLVEELDRLNEITPTEDAETSASPLPEIPLKSSGSFQADLVSDLIMAFGDTGLILFRQFGRDEINKIVSRFNERSKTPEQRKQEYLTERHEQWISENEELFQVALMRPELYTAFASRNAETS